MLAVLSSSIHHHWIDAMGGTQGKKGKTYIISDVFDTFPFPIVTKEQRSRLRNFGEKIDQHIKDVLAEHPNITRANIYSTLEKLKEGKPLTERDRYIIGSASLNNLKDLFDMNDAYIAELYGLPSHVDSPTIIQTLTNLNYERQNEEKTGLIRWIHNDHLQSHTQNYTLN